MTPPPSWSSATFEVTPKPSASAFNKGLPSSLTSSTSTCTSTSQGYEQQQSPTERADIRIKNHYTDPSLEHHRLLLSNGLIGLDALPFDYVFVLDAPQSRQQQPLEEEPALASDKRRRPYHYNNNNTDCPSPAVSADGSVSTTSSSRAQRFLYLSSPDILDLFGEQEWASLQAACGTLMNLPCSGRRRVQQSFLETTTQQHYDMTLFPIFNGTLVAIGGYIQKTEATSVGTAHVLESNKCTLDTVWVKQDDKRDSHASPPGLEVANDEEYGSVCGGCSNSIDMIENKCSGCSCSSTASSTSSATMQEAFWESEERHRTLFENMKQGVVYHDGTDGSTIAANASALRLLGLSRDQMLGKTPMDPLWRLVRHDASTLPIEEYPAVVALQGIPVTGMIMGVCRTSDQTDITWIQLDAVPRFRPGEDKPYQAYTIISDTTEAKQMELNLSRAKEAAKEADQLISAFLATMSHEIRTPLNGILGSLDLVLSNQTDSTSLGAEDLESLQEAMDSGKLLLSIIQDILDLSKIEAGQLDMVCRPFAVQELKDTTFKLAHAYQIYCKKEHLELKVSIQDDMNMLANGQHMYGDQSRLQQLLNSLMTNAIKFTEQGVVSLNIRAHYCPDNDTSRLEFCVQDSGKGIPEDRLEMIFEPFRQAEFSDTRQYGGTGLGLTVSKKLAHLLGGTLHVESKTGVDCHGSRFTFSVPFQPVQPPPPSPSLSAPPTTQPEITPATIDPLMRSIEKSPLSTRHSSSSAVVLLVEDDKVSRRIATRMLQKAGFAVMEAHDGVQAVSLYEQHHDQIDLILMDLMMPNMDGLEATERIRASERQSDCPTQYRAPIVALTAGAMKGDREAALGKGMDSYLTKPISYKMLVETVERCLVEATS